MMWSLTLRSKPAGWSHAFDVKGSNCVHVDSIIFNPQTSYWIAFWNLKLEIESKEIFANLNFNKFNFQNEIKVSLQFWFVCTQSFIPRTNERTNERRTWWDINQRDDKNSQRKLFQSSHNLLRENSPRTRSALATSSTLRRHALAASIVIITHLSFYCLSILFRSSFPRQLNKNNFQVKTFHLWCFLIFRSYCVKRSWRFYWVQQIIYRIQRQHTEKELHSCMPSRVAIVRYCEKPFPSIFSLDTTWKFLNSNSAGNAKTIMHNLKKSHVHQMSFPRFSSEPESSYPYHMCFEFARDNVKGIDFLLHTTAR